MAKRLIAVAVTAFVLSSCAVGNKYDYRSQGIDLEISSGREVAVGVLDQRSYVLTGDKTPQWVGLQRGGFGNPFGVHTASGAPLAFDMTEALVSALKRRGLEARAIHPAPSLSSESALEAMVESGAGRLLLVSMREWKSDTYSNVALHYDVEAEIFDGTGRSLGKNNVTGRRDLGGSAFNPPAHAKEAVPEAFGALMEELLGAEAIVNALQ